MWWYQLLLSSDNDSVFETAYFNISHVVKLLIIIIEIMVFPLDDNFVFGDIFFFLGDNIFLAPLVDILQLFAKWAVVEKKWGFFGWARVPERRHSLVEAKKRDF